MFDKINASKCKNTDELIGLYCNTLCKVLCSGVDDEPRYEELLRGWIAGGTLPDFPKFSQETDKKRRKRKATYEREAKEAKKMKMDREDSSELV